MSTIKREMDPDVEELVEPILEEWLSRHGESEEVVISRRIFDRLSCPGEDRLHPLSRNLNLLEEMPQQLELIAGLYGAEPRNGLVFAPGTHLPWHTNSDEPGVRLYFIYNAQEGSVFRYRCPDTDQVITEEEPAGWSAREFEIPEAGLLWHTVFAAGLRLSIGLRLPKQ